MRKYFYTPIAFSLLLMDGAASQSLRLPINIVYPGLGTYSTRHTDVFSYIYNQAVLAQTKSAAAGIYGERKFLLEATNLYTAAIALPSKPGSFGVNLKYAGFKNFNEYQLGLAYARSLGSKVAIGAQFNYYGFHVPAYIKANTLNFEIGAMVHITSTLNAGFHVYNPMGGVLADAGEKLATVYKMGLGYDASEKFFVCVELVREEDHPVHVNGGIEYRFVKQFFARAGISSISSAAFGGVGVSWSSLRLDICGSYHPQLGWSPGLSLIFKAPDTREETGVLNPL